MQIIQFLFFSKAIAEGYLGGKEGKNQYYEI